MDPLTVFSKATRGWFERTFDAPTPAQALGWPAIAEGGHVLVQAPTGSGKTLAAFLYGIDRLTAAPGEGLELLRTVETVIVDEVHAVAGSKRGAHLALSLERLDRLTERAVQRIGLSATQRPLEEIGRFVSGARPIELVDAGRAKELDLEIVVPVEDMREPGAGPVELEGLPTTSGEGRGSSIWPSTYPELLR